MCWPLILASPVLSEESLPDDINEVLKEWEAVDMPPTAEEQEQWLRELDSVRVHKGRNRSSFWRGSQRWIGFFRSPGREKWDARLDLAGGPARVKLRVGRDLVGARILSGALEIKTRPGKIVAGFLGQSAGVGLLLSRPGRGRTLAPDGNMVRARARVAMWSGIQESRTIQGVGLETRRSALQLQAMAGRLCFPPDGWRAQVQAVTLVWTRPSWKVALSGLGAASGRGLSLWGQGGSDFLNWSGEASIWRPMTGEMSSKSWQAVVSSRPARSWLFQGGLAWGSGGPGSPLGSRSPLLKGDQGRGWAIRSTWKSPGKVKLALLGTESRYQSLASQPRLNQIGSWDFILGTPVAPSWYLSARLRTTTWHRWEWSDRYRWQPPARFHLKSRYLGQIRLTWQGNDRSMVVTGNFLQQGKSAGSGKRVLIGLVGKWRWGRIIQMRAGYGTAWGDPLDLLSAVSPLPGLVLPRHWGSWQSETYAGLSWQKWSWRCMAAVSYRRATPESGSQDLVQGWLESGWSW